MAYHTIDMIFRKSHIRCFVQSLSVHNKKNVIEFEKRDKLNDLVRSYLVKPNDRYKPMFGNDIVKIIVPINSRERQGFLILPKTSWTDLEKNFEDLFFRLYYESEMAGSFAKGSRKELRIKFLNTFGITDDVMTEDTFRKAFDRFVRKKSQKVAQILSAKQISPLNLYKSVS